jgi:hypothetical protein
MFISGPHQLNGRNCGLSRTVLEQSAYRSATSTAAGQADDINDVLPELPANS